MSKSKSKPVVSEFVVDKGVGVNWETNANGWGLEHGPYIAVLMHPVKGMTFRGPFISEDAANLWVLNEGSAEAMRYYGELSESRWYVESLHVPTHHKEFDE
jgi:hypothetical protein